MDQITDVIPPHTDEVIAAVVAAGPEDGRQGLEVKAISVAPAREHHARISCR
jgi:hypothetical protein